MSLVKEGRHDDAALAAECGRPLSPFERALYFHYTTLSILDLYMKDKIVSDPVPKYLKLKRQEEAHLCSIFLEAIRERDGQKIWEIAEAVWFLKGVWERNKPEDHERAMLLSIRNYLISTGQKWPLATIAHAVEQATGKNLKDQGDGRSAFRKRCKALGVPIDESGRGRRKKAK
jgi:hypothetical protein